MKRLSLVMAIVFTMAMFMTASVVTAGTTSRANVELVHKVDLTQPELSVDQLFLRSEYKGELDNGLGIELGLEYNPQVSFDKSEVAVGVTYHKSYFQAKAKTWFSIDDARSVGQKSEISVGVGSKF